jgi:hypothetical protein
MTAFVFHDDDLHSNLFGVAPFTNPGLSATYTNDDLQITTPTPNGSKTILNGLKEPETTSGASHYPRLAPLPPTTSYDTNITQNAKGWLSDYPSLTAKILSRNQPHSPATALGHITASRSGIRSTKLKRSRKPTDLPAPNPSSGPSAPTT